MNEAVYASTSDVASEPYACNLNGLSQLTCTHMDNKGKAPLMDAPIRAVTAAGLFAPAPWMLSEWKSSKAGTQFYGPQDFADMVEAGVNTVVLPVPLKAWESKKTLDELDDILQMIHKSGNGKLKAILQLIEPANVDSVKSAIKDAVKYVEDLKHPETILAVELPDVKYVDEARSAGSSKLPLLVPFNMGEIQHLSAQHPVLSQDPHVYGVLALEHTSTVADIASSASLDDRMKLFYHESVSCMQRAPLEYAACFHNLPLLVRGFDLSIDNCDLQHTNPAAFVNYGQCGRFDETVGSDWWKRHRQSFGERQMFAYEQGLGWMYPAWKLWGDKVNYDMLDHPVKLKSLKAVLRAGLLPDLTSDDEDEKSPLSLACLNPPQTDFVLGDATLAPTPGPPPDCWPGWWNATINDCTYWVPPPTDSPVGCPVCDECDDSTTATSTGTNLYSNGTTEEPSVERAVRSASMMGPNMGHESAATVAFSFVAGAVVALLLGSVWNRRRHGGYEAIPNNRNH